MSILIKGMQMPKNCGDCPFFEAVSCEEDSKDYRCARTGLYVFPREKSVYCPLIELPPHGRLIDADALNELIDSGDDIDFSEVPETKYAIMQMVREQETIIESEG